MYLRIKRFFNKYLTKLRMMLILRLAGKEMPILLNAKIYDDIITYNRRKYGENIIVHNCRIEEIGQHIRKEIHKNNMVKEKGVIRYGNSFVLDPSKRPERIER